MASKTKIYFALIAAGLVALVVDRCSFGASAPASTAASEVDPPAEDAESTPPVPRPRTVAPHAPGAPGSKIGVPELHCPRNLPAFDATSEIRDVFARQGSDGEISDVGRTGKNGSAKKNTAADAIGREAFHERHRIDAVMVQESLRIAVVDGRWMRVGDAVDTCTLIKIEGDCAVFQCHDGDTALTPSGKRTHAPD